MILKYPFDGVVTETVTIRDPNLGDSHILDTNIYTNRTRSQILIQDKDNDWPNIQTFKFEFTTITQSEMTNLLAFLEATAGLLISLTDHKSVERIGFITTPVTEIITTKDSCSYDIKFSFQEDMYYEQYFLVTEDDIQLVDEATAPEYLVTEYL